MLGCMDVLPEGLSSVDLTENADLNLLFIAKIRRLKMDPKSSSQMNLNSSSTRVMFEYTCGEVWGRRLIQNVCKRQSNTEEGMLWFGALLLFWVRQSSPESAIE